MNEEEKKGVWHLIGNGNVRSTGTFRIIVIIGMALIGYFAKQMADDNHSLIILNIPGQLQAVAHELRDLTNGFQDLSQRVARIEGARREDATK